MPRHYHTDNFSLAKSDANNAIPTKGIFALGEFVLNNSGTAGATIGWRCTVAGQAEDTAWIANTAVGPYALVYANGNVYRAGDAGGTTGTIAPSHTTGTATDGTVTWTYLDKHAQFELLVGVATTDRAGLVKQAGAQADSTATDVAGIVADYNALLAKLRTAGILAV